MLPSECWLACCCGRRRKTGQSRSASAPVLPRWSHHAGSRNLARDSFRRLAGSTSGAAVSRARLQDDLAHTISKVRDICQIRSLTDWALRRDTRVVRPPRERAGQRVENIAPHALAAPAVEAVVNRCVRPVVWRTVSPACARSQHVENPADHAPVIHAVRPAPPAWQQRFDPLPLQLAQAVQLLRPLRLGSLNHKSAQTGIFIEYRP